MKRILSTCVSHKTLVCARLQEKTGPGRMRWAPQSHNQQAAPQEQRSAPADGGSTAASEWQPYRCAKHCGESLWWCACAPPGQGSHSWPSWPLKSSTPPSPSPGLPPPGTASSSPSITSATCARTQRDSRPDRDSGEGTTSLDNKRAFNAEVSEGGSEMLPTSQRVTKNATNIRCLVTSWLVRNCGCKNHTSTKRNLSSPLQSQTTGQESVRVTLNIQMEEI